LAQSVSAWPLSIKPERTAEQYFQFTISIGLAQLVCGESAVSYFLKPIEAYISAKFGLAAIRVVTGQCEPL